MAPVQFDSFGFAVKEGGAHASRTIMLAELTALLETIDGAASRQSTYRRAIEEENCLAKRSLKTRRLTFRHLVDLYGLDCSVPVFEALVYYWRREPEARPMLALLCAYARDPILRQSRRFVLTTAPGIEIRRTELEAFLENRIYSDARDALLKAMVGE